MARLFRRVVDRFFFIYSLTFSSIKLFIETYILQLAYISGQQ
jgi:hypothetical protein